MSEFSSKIDPSFVFDGLIVNKINYQLSSFNIIDNIDSVEIQLDNTLVFPGNPQNEFAVEFNLELTHHDGKTNEIDFLLEITASGFFTCENSIAKDDKATQLITSNAAAIAFPYLRNFISSLTMNAGLSQIILPMFDFEKVKS